MGAADNRVSELLDQWLASVELHARYLALDDAAYAKVQDWPRHQRPTRWIVDLARSRCVELKRQLAERGARGDASFADALELMAFLTSLLGSEHVERFIPLAVEGKGKPVPAEPPPRPAAAAAAAVATPPPPTRTPPSRANPKSKTAARNPGRAAAQPRAARRNEASAPERKAPASHGRESEAGRPRRQVRHRHRRRGPAAELGSPLAATREPDRAPRRPSRRARGLDDPAGAPRRDRRAGDSPVGVNRPRRG